jgi:glutathione S-transferase
MARCAGKAYMQTILYYSPGACSLAPHILLEEAGARYRLVEVNVQQGKTLEAAFLELNPKGRVPVLCSDGQMLTEVPAISWYIAASHPGAKQLVPNDSLRQARVLEWFNWLSGTLHGIAFGGKWRPQRFVNEQQLFDSVIAKAEDNLRDGFAYIELRLADRQWAIGDAYTIVDPYLFVFHQWATTIGVDVAMLYPHWNRHATRMHQRAAVQRALEQEGLWNG